MKQETFKSQRKKLFLMYLSAFAGIFLLLAFIMIKLISSSSYVQVDDNINTMAKNPDLLQMELNQNEPDIPFKENSQKKDISEKPNNNPFNTQVILWSSDKKILNSNLIGNRLSEIESIDFSKKELNNMTTIYTDNNSGGDSLVFRSLMIKASSNDDGVAYIQIISNVNQIQGSVKQSTMIIIICMIIFWLISIVVSYYLSRINMKPILKAWDKQQEFVANASHELRTPLTIISLNLERLFTKPTHTILEESESIAEALNETKRLSKLTTDLLLLAKSDSHSLTVELEEVDVNEFINKLIKPFQYMASEEGKQFTAHLSEDFSVYIDQEKIHQVLLILIDNALKYTKKGNHIQILSQINKKHWHVTIENDGSQIEPDKLGKIFQRFYQDSSNTTDKTDGFGLGLAIAKQIMDEHNGRISAKNIEPTGVAFQISLPIVQKNKRV